MRETWRKKKQILKKKLIRLWNISIAFKTRAMYLFIKNKIGNMFVTFCRMKRKKMAEKSRKLMNYLANSSVAFVLRRYLRSQIFFYQAALHTPMGCLRVRSIKIMDHTSIKCSKLISILKVCVNICTHIFISSLYTFLCHPKINFYSSLKWWHVWYFLCSSSPFFKISWS